MRISCFFLAAVTLGLPVVAVAQPESVPPEAPASESTEPPDQKDTPPPADPPTSAPAPTVIGGPTDIAIRGLSWDALGGGVPQSGGLLQAELGFSSLPRIGYHYTLAPGFSLGGLLALDYARWAPIEAFTTSMVIAVPVRYSVFRTETWTIGLRGEPGVRIGFDDPFLLGILLNLQAHVGYAVEPRLIIGGGVDVPVEIGIPDQGKAFFSAPVLIGGFAEFHVTPPLALVVDVKFGPHINTSGNVLRTEGTVFGMRVLAGLAVRL